MVDYGGVRTNILTQKECVVCKTSAFIDAYKVGSKTHVKSFFLRSGELGDKDGRTR